MSKLDRATLRADILESIAAMEAEANNPALPRWVRNRSAAQAARRRKLVERYSHIFTLSEDKPTPERKMGQK